MSHTKDLGSFGAIKKGSLYTCIFTIYLLIAHCQPRSVSLVPRQANGTTSLSVLTLNAPVSRKVHVHSIVYLFPQRTAISRDTGELLHGGHASIWVDGTETDGPLILDLDFTPAPLPSKFGVTAIRAKDLGVAETGKPILPPPIGPDDREYTIFQGATSLTNREIFDHQAGTGLVADAWMEDPVYRVGTGSPPNSCYEFVERTLASMKLDLDPVTKERFRNSKEYYTSYSRQKIVRIPEVASSVRTPEGPFTKVNIRLFNVDFELNPKAPQLVFERTRFLPRSAASSAEQNRGVDYPVSDA
ncbi:MAG: hypothetical protein Q9174_003263 [Haloplaca sp. 1 TL-2023]